jgi:hypothetical protein
VCCTKCIKKEGLIIYQDGREGEPKWGINGKDNGPKAKYRVEIYTICSSCLAHLEAMPVEHINMSRQKREFIDSICVKYTRILQECKQMSISGFQSISWRWRL